MSAWVSILRFMSAIEQNNAPAGWYQDPYNPHASRWWDGCRWTEYTGPQAARPGSLHDEARDVAAGKNTAAIWALIDGLASILFSFFAGLGTLPIIITLAGAVGGIIWGIMGIRRAKIHGVGYGMSIAGLVIGCIMLPLTIAWAVIYAVLT